MDWRIHFYKAKYHLSVTKRMLTIYDDYPETRILVGIIKEAAKATDKLITAFLVKENIHGNLGTFVKKVSSKYLDIPTTKNLVKIIEIRRAHSLAKIEFIKNEKLLLFSDGKWIILKVSRLRGLIKTIENVIDNFPTDIKR